MISWRERSRPPTIGWVVVELAVAVAIVAAGLRGWIPISSNPWMLAVATFFLWWRGPGWRGVGLRRPTHPGLVLLLGAATGVGYQFVGTFVLEPLIARMTSGELPDVSAFRSLVGDENRLVFWVVMSWTLAAFMEEMVYRGWLLTRLAELTRFSSRGWVAAMIGTAALFGAIHLYQGMSGVVANGLSGIVFGCLYLATGRNLWASILAHGFMDTTGFVMIYFGVYPGL